MRFVARLLSAAVVLLLLAPSLRAEPVRLDMDAAVSRALSAHRNFNVERRVDFAQANLERSTAWLPSNPYLSAGAQHTTQSGFGPNYEFLLSQEFEIAGQRQKRVAAASEGLEKTQAEAQHAEQNLIAAVKLAFLQAQIDGDRVTLAQKNVDAAVTLAGELEEHESSSDMQRLDVNVARIQETRARRELAAAEEAHGKALAALRRLLSFPPGQAIEIVGAPVQQMRDLPPTPELVERALQHRADLVAVRHGAQRSTRQVELLRREAVPNVTVSATVSRFEGDTLTGGELSVPLPIFQRKDADITQSAAERARMQTEVQTLEREITQQVTDARATCLRAEADLQALQQDIVPRSEENLQLEQRSYARGEVTVSELVGIEVDLLGARRDYLDALQAYNEALIELERVTGEDLKLL